MIYKRMKRKLLLKFDCAEDITIAVMDIDHLYIAAPKVYLQGVVALVDELAVKQNLNLQVVAQIIRESLLANAN